MTIRSDDHRLRISVADNGPGLPAERDRLTEPYMTTRKRGTGLGLAIVRNIVEDHFGTLSLGDRPGGGTVVELEFDLDALNSLGDGARDQADGLAEDTKLLELTRNGTD